MNLREVFTAEAISLNYTNASSNTIPYLGTGFFPAQQKAGLDLKWVKGHNGLPVSLMPSNFDAKSTFRDRVGIAMNETEMPFFRESMIVKEKDEQEIDRAKDSSDPYAAQVIDNIFNDAKTLVDGADVVPERMRMQLLAPLNGSVGIQIKANNVDYTYNYDPDGTWKSAHYAKIETDADKWSASETCDPIDDLETALDAQEAASGNKPEIVLMSKKTFNYIKNSKKVRENLAVASSIVSAGIQSNIHYTTAAVKSFIEETLDVSIIIYNKQFKDESGTVRRFYPDDIVMMLPSGALGTTWYGTTPEQRTLSKKPDADVSIVNTGVAVSVYATENPVNTITTASEIVLPSFERMDECYAMEVA